jgi:nucleotide-binding universal stress UspA family protein
VKRILVPIDGTEHAEAALKSLTDFSDRGDAIVLLKVEKPHAPQQLGYRPSQVVNEAIVGPAGGMARIKTLDVPVYAETGDQAIQRQLDEAKDYLEALAEELRDRGYAVETEVLIDEHPARAITEYARAMKPAFIAMLRRTNLAMSELIFGSVAFSVMRADIAPVLFIPRTVDAAA